MSKALVLVGPIVSSDQGEDDLTGLLHCAEVMAKLGVDTHVVTRASKSRNTGTSEPQSDLTFHIAESLGDTLVSPSRGQYSIASSSGPILPEILPSVDHALWVGVPFLRTDLPLETLKAMARLGDLALDLDGLARFRLEDEIAWSPFEQLEFLLRLATHVAGSAQGAQWLLGTPDIDTAAALMRRPNLGTVMVKDERRCALFGKNGAISVGDPDSPLVTFVREILFPRSAADSIKASTTR